MNELTLARAAVILAVFEAGRKLKTIAPPPRYHDTRIPGAWDDPPEEGWPTPKPREPSEAELAAEAKRLRKAAKRRESMK